MTPTLPPLPGAPPPARTREVVTPEGVPLRFTLALAGDRLGAFLLDVLVLQAATLVLALGLLGVWIFTRGFGVDLVLAVLTLGQFLLRTFYFSFFELRWQGQTPGKRRLGIRVIDARGGPLAAESVLVRNLTRELEVFLPLLAISSADAVFPGGPGWARLLALAWMVLFGLLPLFDRDRLRVGDLVAGTVVVRIPEAILLGDLASSGAAQPAEGFTEAQLDVYGEYELQVLEQVLRNRGAPGYAESVWTVAAKVRQRIGWVGPPMDDEPFLHAFYAALRGRLERRLLLGKRRASKHG